MNIQWQGNRSDVTAKHGEYSLRAVRVSPDEWEWHVFKTRRCVGSSRESNSCDAPKTRAEAMRMAEQALKDHLI